MLYSSEASSGIGGSKVQTIQLQFNATIKLPDREKPEDADKVTMNEEAQVEVSSGRPGEYMTAELYGAR
ncbi:hypothetical protein NPIL_698141 [Nephila pilipes]|uniref:Uncharacterized protein n=1 Tax=Nephila pilipes TaxID=299642 RepID=A0A8X6UT78_NEPPI|nr:hypothetical protein NPIL_689451 [Nephila pilipes]GFU40723.1 hypothetical protein NPIL_698141 [Nephila pilipes]